MRISFSGANACSIGTTVREGGGSSATSADAFVLGNQIVGGWQLLDTSKEAVLAGKPQGPELGEPQFLVSVEKVDDGQDEENPKLEGASAHHRPVAVRLHELLAIGGNRKVCGRHPISLRAYFLVFFLVFFLGFWVFGFLFVFYLFFACFFAFCSLSLFFPKGRGGGREREGEEDAGSKGMQTWG